jgi:hypothetical protein
VLLEFCRFEIRVRVSESGIGKKEWGGGQSTTTGTIKYWSEVSESSRRKELMSTDFQKSTRSTF